MQDGACRVMSGHDTPDAYTLPLLPQMLFRAVLAAGDADAAGGGGAALELAAYSEEVAAMMLPVEPKRSETPLYIKTQAYCRAWLDIVEPGQQQLTPPAMLRAILESFVDLVALPEFDELRSAYSTLLADDTCAKKSPDEGATCSPSMPKDLIAISHKFAAEMWPVRSRSLPPLLFVERARMTPPSPPHSPLSAGLAPVGRSIQQLHRGLPAHVAQAR